MVDFDTVPPTNHADGANYDIVSIRVTDTDAGLQVPFYSATIALWTKETSPSVQDCLTLTATQGSTTGEVMVQTGSVICVHTAEDRLAIASVQQIKPNGSDFDIMLTATVWGRS